MSESTVARPRPAFTAERTVRVGHITLNAPPARTFPLFTPLGELHWAEGWDPEILYPLDGAPMKGLLFRIKDHGGMTWWMTRYHPANFTLGYHAVAAPLARNIEIRCRTAGNRTEVTVTDTYLGLSEHGNEYLRTMTEAAYAQKMKGWEKAINGYLSKQ